jgi:hypothetical protein
MNSVRNTLTDWLAGIVSDKLKSLLMWLAFTAIVVLVTGCKTDDDLSSRPWNSPKSWENGLPASMTEGR